jgi:hypothetical protein
LTKVTVGKTAAPSFNAVRRKLKNAIRKKAGNSKQHRKSSHNRSLSGVGFLLLLKPSSHQQSYVSYDKTESVKCQEGYRR